LQDSGIKGQRYLTKQSKEDEERAKSQEAFLEKVEVMAKKSRRF